MDNQISPVTGYWRLHGALLAILLCAPLAADQGAQAEIPPPPVVYGEAAPPPPAVPAGAELEPEVVIRQETGKTVYEYRIAGRLVMVKVQPKGAPPYYFYDRDGDGVLDTRTSDPNEMMNVQQWVLFRW